MDTLLQRLWRLRRRWRHAANVQQPLLDAQDMQHLQQFARSRFSTPLTAQRDVQHPLLGERLSTFSGSGYEFAENRLFQAGDDARFINWRVYARSGELYRKVFHEERRPQLWLLVDRRESMCFGTRRRLKVTAAVRQALVYLYQAQLQQLAVGAVVLEETPQWYEAKTSAAAQHELIQSLLRPCPPRPPCAGAVTLERVVRQLYSRLLPGSIVVLLSDFYDLQQSHLASFHALAQQHTVRAVQVLDDIEVRLPRRGSYRVADGDGRHSLQLNCNDADARQAIEQQLQLRHEQIAQWLHSAGVDYQRLLSSDEPFVLERSEEPALA
ncbi:MAG: DUF58 domain-containing protein [Gammaproteobacteria bacterium]